ncbi:hypothetical protein EUGRSUZ_F03265 [Eucalyptus grandis]|uniref:Uncharacterized protein n=2 Tax=Eucalyptus grandis TaxID=71139 RepID=A0ACC3KLS3_EUCGR|nr:hypothetical protein EUGRSUZ_F03265 [Eucalyptus grandis]
MNGGLTEEKSKHWRSKVLYDVTYDYSKNRNYFSKVGHTKRRQQQRFPNNNNSSHESLYVIFYYIVVPDPKSLFDIFIMESLVLINFIFAAYI